jgi:ribosomal protein S1
MNSKNEDFNWLQYDENYKGGNRLVSNKKIKGQDNKNICYSREKYAQDLFDLYSSKNSKIIKKDLRKGDCVPITDITYINGTVITIEISGGLTIDVDLNREKKFIQLFGYNEVKDFIDHLQNRSFIEKFIESEIFAYIIESTPSIKISLWQGHLKKIKEEFMKEIENPSKAYIAKIIEANRGGYFVEVQGVDAFMPGSLAAPNKIIDFMSLIGKEVVVMIEDFLVEMNSFIVSHKKYIEHILPQKLAELNLNEKHVGTITGTSKYGIFAEFDKIFTGLLHNSKMNKETLIKFNNREFKPGDEIEFYINEITKDNRIILTEESAEDKNKKINEFVEINKDKILESEVAAVMNFGIIVNVGEFSGLVPVKEFKKYKIFSNNFIIGDKLKVKLGELKDNKLIFYLNIE